MKGMKGRFLRKLKSISTISSLRQGIFFHASTDDRESQADENYNNPKELFPGRISSSEALNREVQDEEIDSPFHVHGKGNFPKENPDIPFPLESGSTRPCTVPLRAEKLSKESEIHDFQPNPFELLVMEHRSIHKAEEEGEEFQTPSDSEEECPPGGSERAILKAEEESQEFECPTLSDFEENCPPGGSERVILYTTSLRGIRKAFEDCNSVRFLLESFRVLYYERDVSMHLEFREELWRILGGRVVPPRLFIKGRHIGGAEEVVRLHEQGRLRKLFHEIPVNLSGSPCSGCGGIRFLVCFNCNGSRKVVPNELTGELSPVRCLECNENGLIKCPICC